MMKDKRTIMCNICSKRECMSGYPGGIPSYCIAAGSRQIIERTKTEYSATDVITLYKAVGKIVADGYGKWPRIQEAIELAKELKLNKIGLAGCTALIDEMSLIAELFIGAGFKVFSTACQMGRIPPEERGVDIDIKDFRGLYCNPIAQAEILNERGTELNFMIGLCLGHDMLFTRYSKAPVSTLIVKDRVTGHNPAAALYCSSHLLRLRKLYCGKDTASGIVPDPEKSTGH